MTVMELSAALGWPAVAKGEDKLVSCGWSGDLLSHALAHVPENAAWITVMANANVAAIAVLRGLSCVVLADGVQPDKSLHHVAIQEKITILSAQEDAFTASIMLSKQLSRETKNNDLRDSGNVAKK